MNAKKKIFLGISLSAVMAFSLGMPATMRASAAEDLYKPNAFVSDYNSVDDISVAARGLNTEIVGEGSVLLKNEDNALPLKRGAKISIFGKNSRIASIYNYMKQGGFQLNPTLVNFYNDDEKSGKGISNQNYGDTASAGWETGETPQASYTQDIKDSFSEYSDAALIWINRLAYGEGRDAARTMMWDGESYNGWLSDPQDMQQIPGARAKDDHFLQLDQNETDLINMVGENFEKVIVILSTPSTFETGFLDDENHYAYHENIKSALWIGSPRYYEAIPQILSGSINPSGHTVNTWARDFKLDPTWQNFGNYLMGGETDTKGSRYTNLPTTGAGYANNYVTYNEGIYVGYRYYETRGFTEGNSAYTSAAEGEKATYLDPQSGGSNGKSMDYIHGSNTTSWKDWYSAHVIYPFGYGLSYTTFEQTLVSSEPVGNAALTADGTITLKVKVKNTGEVAGKDVVQVYYTAPYKEGEIEKAHVVLAAFDKTKLLAPQEEETLELSFKVRDMASYDYSDANHNSFKGYELDSGEYVVRLMKNSHEEIAKVTYNLAEGVKYETSEATDFKVENRFDEVSNYITDDLNQKYLSRNNWEETWPVFNKRLTASQAVIAGLNEYDITKWPADYDNDKPWYTDEMPTTGAKNGLVLDDLFGKEYDDPQWDEFLDQLSWAQMDRIVTYGVYGAGLDWENEFGIKRPKNWDGPTGVWNNAIIDRHFFYCSMGVLACTWNIDLAYRMGKTIGEDCLWGKNDQVGGYYAPSVNINRNQFGGRNGEYFGEDGLLSGMVSASVCKGSQEKGLAVYVKHFALNNQETDRTGVITWANEQSMRELYFKPFELSVTVGGANGIMSSMNRIGTTWTGGSYELLTNVLRNEWGFMGVVVTDTYAGGYINTYTADQMIRAGGDLVLGAGTFKYNVSSATTVACVRQAVKNILYVQLQTNAVNDLPQGLNYTPLDQFPGALLNNGIVGVNYSADVATATINRTLYPDSSDKDVVYSIDEGSSLPAGLSLSEDGKITGTPTEEVNNYRFSVKATFKGYSKTATFTISIVGANGAIVYEAEQDLGTILVDKTANLSVAGATVVKPELDPGEVLPDCTYSLANGSKLPTGLVLSSDGKITGKPTGLAENYTFSVTASAKGYASVTLPFKLNIYRTMTFETAELANGKLGVSYLQKLPAAVTEGEVTYALKSESKLPNGLELTAGGYIVGIPRETVTDQVFTVVATSPYTEPVEREFKITIGLSFNANRLASGKVGESYRARVDTAQGAGEIKYTLAEGSVLPEGLTLSEDGLLTGTPTKAGVYKLIVLASAEGKEGDTITLTLYIEEASTASGGSEIDPPVEADNGCGSFIGPAGAGVFLIGLGAVCSILLAGKHSRRKEDSTSADEQKD